MDRRVFLVIGAMKCGTTTLYHDLRAHPEVRLAEKESAFLLSDDASAGDAQERFYRAVGARSPGGVLGDVCTTYAMRPDRPSVAERARALWGDRLKVLYIVRDPVRRAISHHRHMHCWRGEGRMDPDFDTALQHHPELIHYSRYGYQLEPWRAALGDDNIRLVVFEEYMRERREGFLAVCRFLGLDEDLSGVATDRVHNASDGKPILSGAWKHLTHSSFYRRFIRPLAPSDLRDAVRRAVLPAAPPAPSPPSAASIERLVEATRGDCELVQQLLNRTEPVWADPPGLAAA